MSTPNLYPLAQLAIDMDIPRRTLARHLKGLEPDGQSGGAPAYKLSSVFNCMMQGDVMSARAAKTRLDNARAEAVEHKLMLDREEVIPRTELEFLLSKTAQLMGSVLGSVPTRLKKLNPRLNARSIEDIRRLMARTADEISKLQIGEEDLENDDAEIV